MVKRALKILLLILAAIAGCARADWPEKPIRVVVPYGPGAMPDVLIRLVSEGVRQRLGQPLIVENRSGAEGRIGTMAAARAAPDGYTLLVGGTSIFSINPSLYPQTDLDPLKAFDAITIMANVPAVIFINASVPAKTFAEFISYAKANPGKLNYGAPGPAIFLPIEQINRSRKLGMTQVAYRGAGQVMMALVANQVQVTLAGAGIGLEQVKAGRVRALGVSSTTRLPLLPDTPTFDEIGLNDVHVDTFWGVAAPAGTPGPVMERLNASFRKVLSDPVVKQRLIELGVIGVGSSRQQMAARAANDASEWSRLITDLGMKK